MGKQPATINPINKEVNICFQYTVPTLLNYEEIKKNPRRITKIKPFINKYNWEGINFPLEKDDWEKVMQQLLLMFSMQKMIKNISCLCFKT